jgi:hypothetical protein
MGGKTGTTSSTTKIPPEVMARYEAVNKRAEEVAAKPFQQYGTTPDQFVAQLNQQQKTGQAGMNQYANAAQPVLNQVQQGYTPEGFSQGVKGYMNPYLESAVASTRNQMQNVAGQQQAQMKGSAIGQGAFGGDRANIGMGNLINQQNLALGQTIGGMESQGFQNAAQNYMSGLGQRGQTALAAQQAGLQGAQAQIGAGTLGQQTEQAGKTALYNQFLQEQAYPYQVAQFLANVAMGTGALSGSSTTTTQPMPFFSDERLKDDIEKIGKTFDGQDIIKFRYKGEDGPKQIGLSAQNVEKHHPEAVGLAKGYKTVDYDAATKDAAKRGHFEEGGLVSEGGAVGMRHMGQGFAAGGGAYDPYDPYSIYNILSRQQGFFDSGDRSHVPSARGLSGGIGKHGRVPEASLPVGRLMTPPPPPAPLESGMSQVMGAANTGETIAKMFSKDEKTGESGLGRQLYDYLMSVGDKDETKEPEKAYGGLVGYASGGMPYDMDEDPKKLDIPDESSKFKLPEQKHLPGAMQDPTMKAIMDMAKLASGFMKNGGRAGYEGGGGAYNSEDELGRYLSAIARNESGGQKDPYAALGPVTKKGDRAYGKYQVMGANIPSWTEEALGQKMTPEEYLANKDAQEKVARHYFGKALDKYGNPEDAASVWFTGKPRAEAGNVADDLGTTNSQYIRKFNEALGRPTEPSEAPRKRGLGEARADLPEEAANVVASYNVPGERTGLGGGPLRMSHDRKTKSGAYTDESQAIGPIGKATKKLLGDDFPTSENIWVPALAGLGSMLSSRSPYFLPALGEGLVGGTSAYTQLNQQQADIAGKLSETEQTKAGTEGLAVKTAGNRIIEKGNLMFVVGANGEPMPAYEWYGLPPDQRPPLSEYDERRIYEYLNKGKSGLGGGDLQKDIMPKEGPTPEIVTAPLSPLGEEKPTTIGAEPEPKEVVTKITLTPDAMSLVETNRRIAMMSQNKNDDVYTPQDEVAKVNRNQRGTLLPLAGAFARLPGMGRDAAGPTQAILKPITDVLNNIAAVLGKPDLIKDPKILTDQNEINKLVTQLQAQVTSAAGQRALGAFQEMADAIPSGLLDKNSQARLMAQIMMVNQREIDKSNYFNDFRSKVSGDRGQYASFSNFSGRNLDRQFEKDYNRNFYSDEVHKLEDMFKATIPQMNNRTVMDVLSSGESLTEKQKNSIRKRFGDKIMRYFGIDE